MRLRSADQQRIKIPIERNGRPVRVRIVGDAAIAAGGVGDGRLIPLVIIDTSGRPDLEELIRVHQHLPPGDVDVRWARFEGSPNSMYLLLSFKRPMEVEAALEFDIAKRGCVVDQILTTKVLYLQAGQDGDRFLTTLNVPRIFVEIPDTGFRPRWDDIFPTHYEIDEK